MLKIGDNLPAFSCQDDKGNMITQDDFIGKRNERACYIHPSEPSKAIKVSYEQKIGRTKQSDTEIKYYKKWIRKV